MRLHNEYEQVRPGIGSNLAVKKGKTRGSMARKMAAPDRKFLCGNQGVPGDGDTTYVTVADLGAFINLVAGAIANR